MSTKQTGGPAFPVPGMSNLPNGEFMYPELGMTLRDYFAAKAMQAFLSSALDTAKVSASVSLQNIEQTARAAYEIADWMLEARK